MTDLTRREATMAALGAVALAIPAMTGTAEAAPKASVEALRALLDAHNKAFTAHDMKGILACMSDKCAIMGTSPGELWVGHKEVAEAYKHFFEDFDPGKQKFESLWHDGGIGPMGAWLMTISKVTMTKGADKKEFGLNLSMTCEHVGGKWLIRAMHFSNIVAKS